MTAEHGEAIVRLPVRLHPDLPAGDPDWPLDRLLDSQLQEAAAAVRHVRGLRMHGWTIGWEPAEQPGTFTLTARQAMPSRKHAEALLMTLQLVGYDLEYDGQHGPILP